MDRSYQAGRPFFPSELFAGVELRDAIAIVAMHAAITQSRKAFVIESGVVYRAIAIGAYELADEMIQARGGRRG